MELYRTLAGFYRTLAGLYRTLERFMQGSWLIWLQSDMFSWLTTDGTSVTQTDAGRFTETLRLEPRFQANIPPFWCVNFASFSSSLSGT